jgi:SAM-dependent methyltransferase
MDDSRTPVGSAAAWDAMAPSYDAERGTDPVYCACIRQAVADLHPAGAVLDCGCGTGLALPYLQGADSVYALDLSEEMLGRLQRKFRSRKLHTARGDVRQLPYPDGMFDCVLVANVLQHLRPSEQPRAAAEIMRTLRPGGRYVVSVHHYSVEKQHAGWKKEGVPGGDRKNPGYIFRYTRDELAALFPGARIRAMGFYGYPAQGLIARMAGHALARLGRGHMLCAHGVSTGPRPA